MTTRFEHISGLLERYLADEGLYASVVQGRRSVLLGPALAITWLAYLWVLSFALVLASRETGVPRAALLSLLAVGGTLVLLLGVLVIYYAARQLRSGRPVSGSDASSIGGAIVIPLPFLAALVTAILAQGAAAFVIYVVMAAVGLAVLLLAQRKANLWGFLLSVPRALTKSLAELPALTSLLIVFTFLAAFSEEVWATIGALPFSRLVALVALLFVPVVLFTLRSARLESGKLARWTPTSEEIMHLVQSVPLLARQTAAGYIAPEEWAALESELRWRHLDRMLADAGEPVLRFLGLWFALLLALMGLLTFLTLFMYHLTFFAMALPADVVQSWTSGGAPAASSALDLRIALMAGLPLANIRVAMFLAGFLTAVVYVWAFADEQVRTRFTSWLTERAASWLAAGAVYGAASTPGYQAWQRSIQQGAVHLDIVVPTTTVEADVELVCRRVESALGLYNVATVTAHVQKPGDPRYKLAIPGRRWVLRRIGRDGPVAFQSEHFEANELRYQDGLGATYLVTGESPPDGWFGETRTASALARGVWDDDDGHTLVMHPWAFESTDHISLEIHLYRALATSQEYRDYLRRLLRAARNAQPTYARIDIELYLRDSMDSLARLFWSANLASVDYWDVTCKRPRYEAKREWES
jgi:hypothetical protein